MTLAASSPCCRRRHFEVARGKLIGGSFSTLTNYVVIVTGEELRPTNCGEKLIPTDFEPSRELARDDLAKIGKGAVDQARVELGIAAMHHELRAIGRNRQLD